MGFFSRLSGGRTHTESEFEGKVKQHFSLSVKILAKTLAEMMDTKEEAEQFVLEELDAARQSDISFIQEFVRDSGYRQVEYIGKINETEWQGKASSLEALQSHFRAFTFQISDQMLRAKFSVAVVDEVMKHWKLGKFR